MVNTDSMVLVNDSIALMALDFNQFENTIHDLMEKKMEEKNQFFHFDEKILISAFCSYIRSQYVSSGTRVKDLKIFADLFRTISCDGSRYITTGIFLMSVLRDLLNEHCNEEIINAWGETFMCVYMQLAKNNFQPETSRHNLR